MATKTSFYPWQGLAAGFSPRHRAALSTLGGGVKGEPPLFWGGKG